MRYRDVWTHACAYLEEDPAEAERYADACAGRPIHGLVTDDVTILNPGSISKPRQSDHRYTYMVMEIDDEDEVTYELRYVE